MILTTAPVYSELMVERAARLVRLASLAGQVIASEGTSRSSLVLGEGLEDAITAHEAGFSSAGVSAGPTVTPLESFIAELLGRVADTRAVIADAIEAIRCPETGRVRR